MGSLFNFGRLTKVWKGLKFGFYGFGFKLSCFCGSYGFGGKKLMGDKNEVQKMRIKSGNHRVERVACTGEPGCFKKFDWQNLS